MSNFIKQSKCKVEANWNSKQFLEIGRFLFFFTGNSKGLWVKEICTLLLLYIIIFRFSFDGKCSELRYNLLLLKDNCSCNGLVTDYMIFIYTEVKTFYKLLKKYSNMFLVT